MLPVVVSDKYCHSVHSSFERFIVFCDKTIKKIEDIVNAILEFVVKVFSEVVNFFDSRFGSKFRGPVELIKRTVKFVCKKAVGKTDKTFREYVLKSGYSLLATKLETSNDSHKEKIHEAIKFARMYAAVHKAKDQETGVDESLLPRGVRFIHDFRCENTGLRMVILAEDNMDKVFVIYGAAGASGDQYLKKNLKDGLKCFLGLNSPTYKLALDKFNEYKEGNQTLFNGKETVFSGQCLGGSLASYVSLSLGEKAFLLNPLGLGARLQSELGNKLNQAKEKVDIVSVNSDITSFPYAPIRLLDFLVNFVGIRTIGSFGNSYVIDPKKEFKWNMDKVHRLILVSLFSTLNIDLPKDDQELVQKFREYDDSRVLG
jgi:hypothetical protein